VPSIFQQAVGSAAYSPSNDSTRASRRWPQTSGLEKMAAQFVTRRLVCQISHRFSSSLIINQNYIQYCIAKNDVTSVVGYVQEHVKLTAELLKKEVELTAELLKKEGEKTKLTVELLKKEEELTTELIKEKQKVNGILETKILHLEAEVVQLRSRHEAVFTMRPLIESSLAQLMPRLSTTQAMKKFVSDNFFTSDGKLNSRARELLSQLEGNSLKKAEAVRTELSVLYHELSKSFHFPELRDKTGLVCGGPMPLRAATAMVLLELQRKKLIPYPIHYMNEQYMPLRILCEGRAGEVSGLPT
jgi:hypothetical protein